MEDVIRDIIETLRSGETLDGIGLEKLLHRHNRLLTSGQPHYSKKWLLNFYLNVKQTDSARWESWQATPEIETALLALLRVKPRRTASGVATITVITKPWKCANACLYCPNDIRMPKSYLHDEPACQRAEQNFFDPYLQAATRLRSLRNMGHPTDKVEMIVLGGTWNDYPEAYRVWFIGELFAALNDADDERSIDRQNSRRSFYENAGLTCDRQRIAAQFDALQQRIDSGAVSYNEAFDEAYTTWQPWQEAAHSQTLPLAELNSLQHTNETAAARMVGLVVETRPAGITAENLTLLRRLGCTKVQMGIQSLDSTVLAVNHRPTPPQTAARALNLARLFGFKTHTHFMVNLKGSTPQSDKADYARFMHETPFQPDEVKIYPCSLVGNAALTDSFEDGSWQPYDEETLIDVLAADTCATPPFCRISRMIRDISSHDIQAGNRKANLRQLVENHIAEQGDTIKEIRHREINNRATDDTALHLDDVTYETGATTEHFLQWITDDNRIAGFLRLSLPKAAAFDEYDGLPTTANTAMIREVHVYGRAALIHEPGHAAQHKGLGKALIAEAENIARAAGYRQIDVISSVGTREYYRAQGFADGELYQFKAL